jgi:hypothetical protein
MHAPSLGGRGSPKSLLHERGAKHGVLVIVGFLGDGVASCTKTDPQATGLGETYPKAVVMLDITQTVEHHSLREATAGTAVRHGGSGEAIVPSFVLPMSA